MRCIAAARHSLGNIVDGWSCAGHLDFPAVDGYTGYDNAKATYDIDDCPAGAGYGQPGQCVKETFVAATQRFFFGRYDGVSAWLNGVMPWSYNIVGSNWGPNTLGSRFYFQHNAGSANYYCGNAGKWKDLRLSGCDCSSKTRVAWEWRTYSANGTHFYYLKNVDIRPEVLVVPTRHRPAGVVQVQTRRHWHRYTAGADTQG